MDNILVTGFGPFQGHTINASWEAVKMLPDNVNGCRIIKEEVPVMYDYVERNIPKLWETLKPVLAIHVGVSSSTSKLTIEKCAHRTGYRRCDFSGKPRRTGKAVCVGEECIYTGIEVDEICSILNRSERMKACPSTNAGRYLCEFIFYTSLNIDSGRTLFVHVPPLGEPYSAEELAEGLMDIIKAALRQIL
ncbi:hypothetical protein NQ318_010036 [Aromia moschata]|uniref:Pyroglutamyl-peptidase I n=1 Tax=Aromia moschata TaxID=1265417 RepID=A0AAV8Y8R8_9CUCU|nr:hypothetical protein NQ318_010036 [Aromia moschata]